MIQMTAIRKVYSTGRMEVAALKGVDLTIGSNEYVSIVGPSGSGKSTLMNLIGCLDHPDSGTLMVNGVDIGAGAKIGSNSVVVKGVPPGATVVGVPGRMVDESAAAQAERSAARFAAYGVMQDQDDPYAKAIQSLVEHTQELERSLAAVSEKLAALESGRGLDGVKDGSLRAVK